MKTRLPQSVPQRTTAALVAVVIAAVLAGWYAHGLANDDHTASARIVEGWAYHGVGGGIGCCGDTRDEAGGLGYNVAAVSWRDLSRPSPAWHDSSEFPECLGEVTATRVRMGVVDVRPHGAAPGGPRAVWLECL